MINGEFDEGEWQQIWSAPEGNEYCVQFRLANEKKWFIMDYALSKPTAIHVFSNTISSPSPGCEYRIVKLSRYPPCSVVAVVRYIKGEQ